MARSYNKLLYASLYFNKYEEGRLAFCKLHSLVRRGGKEEGDIGVCMW